MTATGVACPARTVLSIPEQTNTKPTLCTTRRIRFTAAIQPGLSLRLHVIEKSLNFCRSQFLIKGGHKRSTHSYFAGDEGTLRLRATSRHLVALEQVIEAGPELLGFVHLDVVTNHAVLAIDRPSDLQAIFFPRHRAQGNRAGRAGGTRGTGLLGRTVLFLAEMQSEVIDDFAELRFRRLGPVVLHGSDNVHPPVAGVAQFHCSFVIVTLRAYFFERLPPFPGWQFLCVYRRKDRAADHRRQQTQPGAAGQRGPRGRAHADSFLAIPMAPAT